MRAEKIEHRPVRRELADSRPQRVRGETGEIEKALRTRGVGEDPRQRRERQIRNVFN